MNYKNVEPSWAKIKPQLCFFLIAICSKAIGQIAKSRPETADLYTGIVTLTVKILLLMKKELHTQNVKII